jgi:hypothetical protein
VLDEVVFEEVTVCPAQLIMYSFLFLRNWGFGNVLDDFGGKLGVYK